MFEIQVLRKDLSTALEHISSTVGNNSQNLGDDCVSIKDLGNNQIEIYTTNIIEFSCIKLVVSNGSKGSVEQMPYVNFKRFKTLIDSIPEDEYISIKGVVNDIEITYGTRQKPLKLNGSVNGMVSLTNVNDMNPSININKKILEEGLKKACVIINDNANNVLNNCLRVATNSFNVEITAVDAKDNRMFLYQTNNNTEQNSNTEVVIEANKLKKAFSLFKEFSDIKIISTQNVIKITGESPISSSSMITEASYYTRVINGTYPNNISKMFQNVSEYAVVDKDELLRSLIRIDAIEDTTIGNGTMDMNINKNVINIVKTSQYGIVEDSFSTENEITDPIIDTFKTKPFAEILKTIADNGTYGTSNTFEIGKCNNVNANYYIIRDKDSSLSMFLITGFATNANP